MSKVSIKIMSANQGISEDTKQVCCERLKMVFSPKQHFLSIIPTSPTIIFFMNLDQINEFTVMWKSEITGTGPKSQPAEKSQVDN